MDQKDLNRDEEKGVRERMEESHARHRERMFGEDLPWRAWGSWFSWGSPVGLSIFFSSTLVSLGIFLYFLHVAGLVR